MRDLSDNSIDLFMCDLPYGCLNGSKAKWDEKIDLEKFWKEVERLCKNDNTPVIMFCNTRFGFDLYLSNKEWFRYDLVWKKNKGSMFLNANKQPLQSHEMIYVFAKKRPFYKRINEYVEGAKAYNCNKNDIDTVFGKKKRTQSSQVDNYRCPKSVLDFPVNISKLHPTCKSIDLYKWLIERYSNEGDMVLDPTAGSFNSGRASVELKRNYIGMEMNNDYFEKNNLSII
jgi:site-specific DNA-methyltransferase (adenine-specific)